MEWHVKIWYKDDVYNSLINLTRPDFISLFKKDILKTIYMNYLLTSDMKKEEIEKIVEDFFIDKILEDYEVSEYSLPRKMKIKNAIIAHVIFKKEVLNPNDLIILKSINLVYENRVKNLRSYYSYVFSKDLNKNDILNFSYKTIANRLLHDVIIEEV